MGGIHFFFALFLIVFFTVTIKKFIKLNNFRFPNGFKYVFPKNGIYITLFILDIIQAVTTANLSAKTNIQTT